jgi:hypothetical protein
MLKALSPAAVLFAMLALAGPAAAQAPATTDSTPAPVCTGTGEADPGTCTSAGDQTIGDGQVVTDPAAEVDGPTAPDDGDRPAAAAPKRGELHVLGNSASATSAPRATATARPAAAPSAKTLPFTGIDAGPLALMGVLMLGTGLLLRRRVAA